MNSTIFNTNYIRAYLNNGAHTEERLYLLNDYECFMRIYQAYFTLISSKVDNINGILTRSVGVISPRYNDNLIEIIKDCGGELVGATEI